MIGKTILHYKILDKLGEGGMGIVYKAEDTKLERSVAIKFLPRHISASSENRERLKNEAKVAAALNHPNIAHIYAIEEKITQKIKDDELECLKFALKWLRFTLFGEGNIRFKDKAMKKNVNVSSPGKQ